MAREIEWQANVYVDTDDFSVPEVSDLKKGILRALMAMINEEDVYAGCMGGIGRTGIFLAALAKVQIEYRKSKHRAGRGEDPVLYVRKHFIPHAVETAQQEKFIADLDVSDIVEWLSVTQTAMGLGGLTPARKQPVDLDNRHPYGNIPVTVGQTVRTCVGPVHLKRIEPKPWITGLWDDSADKLLHEDAWVSAIDDLNRTVEDLSERLELSEGNIVSLETYHRILNERTSNQSHLINNLEKRFDRALTKQSLFRRIRSIFK
jgi:hypothetical protein